MLVMIACICKYTKVHYLVCFAYVNCMVCTFYLNKAVKNKSMLDLWTLKEKNINSCQDGVRDFPGGPVVKIPHFHCRGHMALIFG